MTQEISPLLSGLIGGITGGIEITITYPTEYAKTVMQLSTEKNKLGATQLLRQTVKNEGFLACYRGYNVLLTTNFIKTYIRFGTFDYLQRNVIKEKSRLNSFICGTIAGACEAIFIVTP